MKTNHKKHGKTIFLTILVLILLFVAILIPVGTTLGKYSQELDALEFKVDVEIPIGGGNIDY